MRLPDWEDRLAAIVEVRRDWPFEWGRHDCILWATACAAAMTGTDLAEPFRGQYSDREGAARVLREIGEGTLIRTVNHYFPRKPASMAQRGDLVMHGTAIGVCIGAKGLFVGEEGAREGLVTVPRAEWSRAWGV